MFNRQDTRIRVPIGFSLGKCGKIGGLDKHGGDTENISFIPRGEAESFRSSAISYLCAFDVYIKTLVVHTERGLPAHGLPGQVTAIKRSYVLKRKIIIAGKRVDFYVSHHFAVNGCLDFPAFCCGCRGREYSERGKDEEPAYSHNSQHYSDPCLSIGLPPKFHLLPTLKNRDWLLDSGDRFHRTNILYDLLSDVMQQLQIPIF
jgi:hypothetical protein